MKLLFSLVLFLSHLFANHSFAQQDTALINKYGADQYGMKKYVLVFLKSGKTKIEDQVKLAEIQKGHMDNIKKLADDGKLVLAGPFLDKTDLRGIFILNVSDIKEAEELVNTDPAVVAGALEMELHPWYGSAAIMEIPEIHKKLQKSDF